jgi:hypothetical protein
MAETVLTTGSWMLIVGGRLGGGADLRACSSSGMVERFAEEGLGDISRSPKSSFSKRAVADSGISSWAEGRGGAG